MHAYSNYQLHPYFHLHVPKYVINRNTIGISINVSVIFLSFFPHRALGTAFTFDDLTTPSRVECGNFPGLQSKQQRICKRNRDLMPSVAEGAHVGITECQWQFRGRRWNCTTVDGDNTVFGKVIEYGKCFLFP